MDKAWLKAFEVFDVYTGDAIPADKKSLAISLTLQDDKRTLVDAEINEVISAIIRALGGKISYNIKELIVNALSKAIIAETLCNELGVGKT